MKTEHKDHPLLATKQDISIASENLISRIERWKLLQAIHMPNIHSTPTPAATSSAATSTPTPAASTPTPAASTHSSSASKDSSLPENERLLLPSNFSKEERQAYGLNELANEETQLRQAQLYECLMQLRRIMKAISTMHKIRRKSANGQQQTTRCRKQTESVELTRDRLLAIYKSSRTALSALNGESPRLNQQFPSLTVHDLYRKPTVEKRKLNDTYHTDGAVWIAGKTSNIVSRSSTFLRPPETLTSSTAPGNERPSPSSPLAGAGSLDTSEYSKDDMWEVNLGKLWNPAIGLTDEELIQWEHEGEII